MGASDVEWALEIAARYGREYFVRKCCAEWGATNIEEAIQEAEQAEHAHIVSILLHHTAK